MLTLNQKIDQFGHNLLSYKSMRPEDQEELKSHFENAVFDLLENGLTEEEALYIATQRLGNLDQIDEEYAKTNTGYLWQKRFLWLIAGYFLFSLIPYLVMYASYPIHRFLEIESFMLPSGEMFVYDFYLPYPLYFLIPAIVMIPLIFKVQQAYEYRVFSNYTNVKNRWFTITGISFLATSSLYYIYCVPLLYKLTDEQLNFVHFGDLVFKFAWTGMLFLGVVWINLAQRRRTRGLQLT